MARIVFMGTPQFAVESLRKIIEAGHEIIAVVTVPDKPAGRGLKMLSSAVCLYSKDNDIPLLQPVKLNDTEFVEKMQSLNPDIIVVVAFRKLPKSIWSIPKYGTFNVHASLLPQYRGAAPMNHAIINGETETGITTFLLDDNIDTGSIIMQEKVEILHTDTLEDLHDKMMVVGANLAVATIDRLMEGNFNAISQETIISSDTILQPAPKISKEFCEIDWNNNTIDIYNKIRGLSPVPSAFTNITIANGNVLTIKIFKTSYEIAQDANRKHGEIVSDNKKYMGITSKDGIIYIEELQQSGKKRMDIEAFLRGTKVV